MKRSSANRAPAGEVAPKPKKTRIKSPETTAEKNLTIDEPPALRHRSLDDVKKTPQTLQDRVTHDINAKVQEDVLCAKCQHMVSRSEILNGREKNVVVTRDPQESEERLEQFVHYTEDAMYESVCNGCHFCAQLWHLVCFEKREKESPRGDEVEDDEADPPPPPKGSGAFHSVRLFNWRKKYGPAIQRREKRERLLAMGSPPSPGIIVQILCDGSDFRSVDYININVELGSHIGFRVETDGHRCLTVKPFPEKKEKKKDEWEANRDDPIDQYRDAQVSISTASEGSFELAKEWLNRCLRDHKACRAASSSPSLILPTRLLDVGSSETAEIPTLQLRMTKELTERPPYLCLSHCWGGADPLRLQKHNLTAFLEGIPETALLPTLRDAITITRRLGYRFLWIDSLCIIQDSPEDWQYESATMGDVYRGSTCTISALDAADSYGGCFTTRNPLLYRPCVLIGDRKTKGMVCRGANLRHSRDTRLHKRAWVLQERALAPRTLQYGGKSISWECIECDARESWPEGDTWDWEKDKRYRRPKEAFESLLGISTSSSTSTTGWSFDYDEFKSFHHAWCELRLKYSCCSLTKADDKLVAIHGVIKKVEECTDLTSIAGLWQQCLLPELLWHSSGFKSPKFRPEFMDPDQYRAPSWSWACLDIGVTNKVPDLVRGRYESILNLNMWISYTLAWKAEILTAHATTKPNGQVTDGFLRIRGPMRRIEWGVNQGMEGLRHNHQARSVNDKWLPDFLCGTADELWGMLITRGSGSSNVKDGRIDVCIALEPAVGKGDGEVVFRRCGYFEQCYWSTDTYPLFAGEKGIEMREITII